MDGAVNFGKTEAVGHVSLSHECQVLHILHSLSHNYSLSICSMLLYGRGELPVLRSLLTSRQTINVTMLRAT
jgi:hypothetical protein